MIARLSLLRNSLALLALVMVFGQGASAQAPATPLTWTALALINGWKPVGQGTHAAAAAIDPNNMIHLRGAVLQKNGNNPIILVLPAAYRPNHLIFVPALLAGSTTGSIAINTDGAVSVTHATDATIPRNFTSLESVAFSK